MTDAPVALVTGGASGIGVATARRLLDQAHRVTITGRDHHRLGRLTLAGARPHDTLTDGDPDRWREMVLTNVLGPACSSRPASPQCSRHGGGSCLSVASQASSIPRAISTG